MNEKELEYRIEYTVDALNDLANIADWILEYTESIYSAHNVVEKLKNRINLLKTVPLMGTLGKVEGTRELYLGNYRVIYEMHENTAFILAIMHGTKKYP